MERPFQQARLQTSEEARTWACNVTSGKLDARATQVAITHRQATLSHLSPQDGDSYTVIAENLESLKQWQRSAECQSGYYRQGADTLIIELIELRAMLFAFQNVEAARDPFKESGYHAQWLIGAVYTMTCLLGKLVENDAGSLRAVWKRVGQFIKDDNACTPTEADYIDQLFEEQGHFSRYGSDSIIFRNKVIAHNERSHGLDLESMDADIKMIFRIWAIIVSWCSFGLLNPFRDATTAFNGLEGIFTPPEVSSLKQKRDEYMNKAKDWCAMRLDDQSRDPGRSPFATVTVSINLIPRKERPEL